MTQTMMKRVEGMKQLALELSKGNGSWESYCGYLINEELYGFINMTEELMID